MRMGAPPALRHQNPHDGWCDAVLDPTRCIPPAQSMSPAFCTAQPPHASVSATLCTARHECSTVSDPIAQTGVVAVDGVDVPDGGPLG